MARDSDGVGVVKWASGASADVATPESEGLDRATGWPLSYSEAGGGTPEREVFNYLHRLYTAILRDIEIHGLLEWAAAVAYAHPALVRGSNGVLYTSVRDTTGDDPTTDDGDDWLPLSLMLDIHARVTRAATPTNTDRFIFSDESEAGDPTSYTTGADLKTFIAPNSSTARRGLIETATKTETVAGTDTSRATTPEGVAAAIAAGNAAQVDGFSFSSLTQAEYDALPTKDANTVYLISG